MDEKLNIDNKKETIHIDNIETNELENHSIYTYLVDHPPIMIAAASAIVAVFSFFISYVAYMKEAQVLRFWNIDTVFISKSNKQLFYSVSFSLIYSIISFMAMSLISNTYIAYRPFAELNIYLKTKVTKCQKSAKNNKRRLKKIVSKFSECDKKESLQIEINDINYEIKHILEESNQLKREMKEQKKSFRKMLYANLLIALILSFISSVIVFCADVSKQVSANPIMVITIWTIFQFLMYCLIGYLGMRLTISKKRIIATVDNKENEIIERITKAEYPIAKISKYGFKSYFTNSTIYSILINLFAIMVMFIVTSAMTQSSNYKEQKKFKLLSIDNSQYVVIFSDTEKMILEEAKITDGAITIYTSKQRIVSIDTYPFEVVTFEKVIQDKDNTSY